MSDLKDLDKLIEQILGEDVGPFDINKVDPQKTVKMIIGPGAARTSGGKAFAAAFKPKHPDYETEKTELEKALQQIDAKDTDDEKISAPDVAKSMVDPTGLDDRTKTLARSVYRQADANQDFRAQVADMITNLEKADVETGASFGAGAAQGDADIESISFPRVSTNLSNTEKGMFLGSQNDLIGSVFTEGTIQGRLQRLVKVSQAVMDPSTAIKDGITPRKLLQYTQVVDLFNAMINQVDQRSGGYQFESFLALLCGGSVSGGSNGIADFERGEAKGSSKLYQSWYKIEQSTKDFTGALKSFHYVIGVPAKSGKAVLAVDLYYVICTVVGKGHKGALKVIYSDADGRKYNVQHIEKSQRFLLSKYVDHEESFKIGEVVLQSPEDGGATYRDKLNDMIKDPKLQKKKSVQAMKLMKSFFSNMYQAEENTKKYINQPEWNEKSKETGTAALVGYDNAGDDLEKLLEILTGGQKQVSGEKGSRELTQENKMEALAKLIAETLNK